MNRVDEALLELRVERKARVAQGICAFELVAAKGDLLPPFAAGAHIEVNLPNGLVRQYSLCNAPHERGRYVLGVLLEPASRGGSRAMHEQVKQGDLLRVSAPRNHFPLAPQAERSLLFAGGIGITPLLSMAEALSASGAEFEMHYCCRSRERAAFMDRIAAAPYAARVHFHFDDEAREQRFDPAAVLRHVSDARHLYVCGPQGFMDAALSAARQAGWPERQLHWEYFSASSRPNTGGGEFQIRLARSGLVLNVPADKSVVQALTAAGVNVPVSCEQGVCGTCVTKVVAGVPEHRDMYLTPDERARNDRFTPCCSRSCSAELVLDL